MLLHCAVQLEGCPGALNSTRCNTGSLCSLNGTCIDGVCVGKPKACPAANSCRGPGTCSPATGALERLWQHMDTVLLVV
jgi:hypothetical protein